MQIWYEVGVRWTLDDVTAGHKRFREEAVNLFEKKEKMGGYDILSKYQKELEDKIEVTH